MGKKRREGEIDTCVPIKLSKNVIDGIDESSQDIPPLNDNVNMSFTPKRVLNIESTQMEEKELFGSPITSSSESEHEDNDSEASVSSLETDDGEIDKGEDDDGGLCFNFNPLTNFDALNFIIEKDSLNTNLIHDYFNDDCFLDTSLEHECLLVAMYVYYLRTTQKTNFNRVMNRKPWLTDIVKNKLMSVQGELLGKFGPSVDNGGRGRWDEVNFIRERLVKYFPTKYTPVIRINCKRSVLKFMKENSCPADGDYCDSIRSFPIYILQFSQFDSNKKNVSIQKILGHNDDGIFPHDDPCVLMLKDGHYFNIWQYEKLFMDVDGPCVSARKCSKGSVEHYKKRFCLCCIVSYSSQSLHICQHWCKRCLATADEHVMNVGYGCAMIEKVCEKCKYTFTNDFCYETFRLRKLSGKLETYCDFLAQCKNCDGCIEDFELTSQFRHYGKINHRGRRRKDDDILVGGTFSTASLDTYIKCGFCSDYYLKGSTTHNCFLKPSDSLFKSNQCLTTIKTHNVFYYDIESRLEQY